MNDLTSFFSQQSEEEHKKAQEMLNKASADRGRKPVLPGIYIMKVGTFAWTDKKAHEMRTSPEITISRNNALLLNISLQVDDAGTEVVPNGSSIFHTITLLPAKGADEKKINDTLRFMKPQLAALLGNEDIHIDEKWLKEWCTADFIEEKGKFKIVRPHKMIQQVLVTVDEVLNKLTNKPKIGVVKIDKPMPGDKSTTYRYNTKEDQDGPDYADKVMKDDVPEDVDISPNEESEKSTSVKHIDTSKITGSKIEEDF